jgi:two-component system cell cycle sensor histidine kinase/response regulator CckA
VTTNSLLALVGRLTGRVAPLPPAATRILVVDDEEPVRRYVDRVLSAAGYQTTLAVDGPDAVRIARSNSFDLLLTDVMMPDMSGPELTRRLRQDTPELKVLYLTGCSDRLFHERPSLWEAESFIEKPCSAPGLLEAVSLAATGRLSPADGRPTG